MRARTSSPAGPGAVAGRSRASRRKAAAETAAATPNTSCIAPIDMTPTSAEESPMPAPTPSMLASVISPTAVARSPEANQFAGTLVHALSRNGCATAMPMVQTSTSV